MNSCAISSSTPKSSIQDIWNNATQTKPVSKVAPIVNTPTQILSPKLQYQQDIEKIANRSTSETLFDRDKSEFGFGKKVLGFLIDTTVGDYEKNIRQKVLAKDISDDVAKNKLDPSVYNSFEKLNQTTRQDVGDAFEFAVNAATLAYGGTGATRLASSKIVRPLSKETLKILTPETAKLASRGVVKEALKKLTKEGAKEGALIGLTYGIAQALKSGSNDPAEISKIILTNTGGGAILGSAANVLIPQATRLVVNSLKSKNVLKESVIAAKEKVLNPVTPQAEIAVEKTAQKFKQPVQETSIQGEKAVIREVETPELKLPSKEQIDVVEEPKIISTPKSREEAKHTSGAPWVVSKNFLEPRPITLRINPLP